MIFFTNNVIVGLVILVASFIQTCLTQLPTKNVDCRLPDSLNLYCTSKRLIYDNYCKVNCSKVNGISEIINSINSSENIGNLRQWIFSGINIKTLGDGSFSGLNILTLDLSSNSISRLSDHVFDGVLALEVLHLSNNKLKYLNDQIFDVIKTSLKWLFIDKNSLDDVPNLSMLTKLTSLSLKNNEIKNFGSGKNVWPDSLERLDLSVNKLISIEKSYFENVKNLKTLNLSNNLIDYIDPYAFHHLKSLKYLYLEGNNISRISNKWFSNLESIVYVNMAKQRKDINSIEEYSFQNKADQVTEFDLSSNTITYINYKAFCVANKKIKKFYSLILNNTSFNDIKDPCIFRQYKRFKTFKLIFSDYHEKKCSCETINYFLDYDISLEITCYGNGNGNGSNQSYSRDSCVRSRVQTDICSRFESDCATSDKTWLIVGSTIGAVVGVVILIVVVIIVCKRGRNSGSCKCDCSTSRPSHEPKSFPIVSYKTTSPEVSIPPPTSSPPPVAANKPTYEAKKESSSFYNRFSSLFRSKPNSDKTGMSKSTKNKPKINEDDNNYENYNNYNNYMQPVIQDPSKTLSEDDDNNYHDFSV